MITVISACTLACSSVTAGIHYASMGSCSALQETAVHNTVFDKPHADNRTEASSQREPAVRLLQLAAHLVRNRLAGRRQPEVRDACFLHQRSRDQLCECCTPHTTVCIQPHRLCTYSTVASTGSEYLQNCLQAQQRLCNTAACKDAPAAQESGSSASRTSFPSRRHPTQSLQFSNMR